MAEKKTTTTTSKSARPAKTAAAAAKKAATAKPAETRMGGGKGSPDKWVAVVKPGKVMFELAGVSEPVAREAMRLAMHKLPIRSKFVTREGDLFES